VRTILVCALYSVKYGTCKPLVIYSSPWPILSLEIKLTKFSLKQKLYFNISI